MRTRVKICGFTRPDEARAAGLLGVDAVGLVFYRPSPRHVGLEQAQAIIAALPPFVTVVGLFVDAAVEEVRGVLSQARIDVLQFHGDESPAYCASFGRAYIKAVRMRAGVDLLQTAAVYASASGLLLDADDAKAKGGTGTGFDWGLIPPACPLPLILAGGLRPDTVKAAVQQTRPYGVDVSSGVEAAKGVKDIDKMAAFINEVHDFDHAKFYRTL
jgi:phosphoribosylanthranilate isomerase